MELYALDCCRTIRLFARVGCQGGGSCFISSGALIGFLRVIVWELGFSRFDWVLGWDDCKRYWDIDWSNCLKGGLYFVRIFLLVWEVFFWFVSCDWPRSWLNWLYSIVTGRFFLIWNSWIHRIYRADDWNINFFVNLNEHICAYFIWLFLSIYFYEGWSMYWDDFIFFEEGLICLDLIFCWIY